MKKVFVSTYRLRKLREANNEIDSFQETSGGEKSFEGSVVGDPRERQGKGRDGCGIIKL